MRTHVLCLVMLLIIGIGVKTGLGASQEPTPKEAEARAYLREKQFKVVLVGELKEPDVSHVSFTNYKADDGTTATLIDYVFPSPSNAKEYLEKRLSRDKKLRIIERGDKTDSKKIVGTRVHAEFDSDSSATPVQAILWTVGPHFYEITTVSLKAALAFENAFS